VGIFDTIGQVFRATAESVGLASKRSDLNNSPEMQANAAAKIRQQIADKVNDEIAQNDLDAERKDAAE
jgi:hypothetical protein